MDNKIFFSIAKYVPDLLRDEQINFGFAYFYPNEKKLGFIPSKNTGRILAFDDELDFETYNLIKNSLEYEFSVDLFDIDDDETLLSTLLNDNSAKILEYKINNYINQIQFSSPYSLIVDKELHRTLEDISEIYLYYDKPKKERKMDKDRIKQLSKQILKSHFDKHLFVECKKDSMSFLNKPYDFKIIYGKEYKYLKALTFDYKKHFRLYEELKIFMYELEKLIEDNPSISQDDFIVVINKTEFSTREERIAKKILEEKVKLLTIDKLYDDINQQQTLIQ